MADSNTDRRPLCPKCGCPALYIQGHAFVAAMLNLDGSIGEMHRVSNLDKVENPDYICGGGHKWKLTP